MKSHILILENRDNKGILCKTLDQYSTYSYEIINKALVKKKWNKLSSDHLVLVVSDYLIETQADADTVIRFIESFTKTPGFKFYSPRPNSYVAVNDAALYGSSLRSTYYKKTKKEIIKYVYNSLVNFSPNIVKKFLKQLKDMIYVYRNIKNQNKKSMKEIHKPEVEIPKSLIKIRGQWNDWKDEKANFRDLTHRNHLYFPHPIDMHVAVLNQCNLKCVMCPYHSPVYKKVHTSGYFDDKKSLNLETFKKLAKYAGSKKINLQFGQIEETLTHPDIFDFIKIAKDYGVPHIHLTTNGTSLSRAKAESLAKSGVDRVMFSVDSVDSETYKKIRGASLEKLERNIDYFIPLAKSNNITVMCSFIRQKLSEGQRDAFLEKWKAKKVDQVTFYVLTDFELDTGEFIRTEQFREDEERYACASPWVQTAIMPDGGVGLCCKTMTDVGWKITTVGNVNYQDFDEVWKSDRYKKVRQELLTNNFEEFSTCKKCPMWSASTNIREYNKDYIKNYNETTETITFMN